MITVTKATEIVQHFIDAGALGAGSLAQGVTWAQIINDPVHGVPDLADHDAMSAALEAGHKWAAEGRSWKIDAYRYVQAVKNIRRDRIEVYKRLNGTPAPEGDLSGIEYAAWLTAANRAIASGETSRETVEGIAYAAINREPPQESPAITGGTIPTLKGIPA
ncbi:hypothetical protein U6G28_08935 [Actinomycetaceae bacterium MB13-C1-2]|nr:hypothetical protein U6G28_08935 [Actinomycetaceae bacterium MB13-C1-2]